jgi:ceroid-lipofuscinosis MFS transporter 7
LNTTSSALLTTTADAGDKGCPLDYHWCYYVPRVQLWQYIMASVIITVGFSICNVICYSIFSKKLGDRPQGTMMGIFTSAGSLARAFGPIAVGFLYKHGGPRVMMIFMLVFVLTGILSLVFNYQRLYIEAEDVDDADDEDNNDEERHINGDDRYNSNENITA